MRHRFRVALYNDDPLDLEVIEYISRSSRRQEMLRSLIRAGYALLVSKQSHDQAIVSSMPSADLAAVTSAVLANQRISGAQSAVVMPEESPTHAKEVDSSPPPTPKAVESETKISKAPDASASPVESNEAGPLDFMDILKL